MAVPKRKTSKSRRDKRRSHHALSLVNIISDRDGGGCCLQHRMNLKTGKYKGQQIVTTSHQAKN